MFKGALSILTFFLLLVGMPTSFAAIDCVINRASFEDKSAQMSFEQAKDQFYEPSDLMLAKGFSQSAYWLRLKVDPNSCKEAIEARRNKDQLIVRIQPSYLDDVQLFDPLEPSEKLRAVGDRQPSNANEYLSLNYNFVIPEGSEPRYIWLRLKTNSTTMMRSQVFHEGDVVQVDKTQELGFGIYIGLLLLFFFWAVGIWAVDKDLLTAVFAVSQIASLAHALIVTGYFRVFIGDSISPNTLDFISCLAIFFFSFIVTLFQYIFYRMFGSSKWVIAAYMLAITLFVSGFVVFLSGNIGLGLNINAIGLLVLSSFVAFIPFYGVDWTSLQKPILTKRSLFFIYLLCAFIGWSNLIPALGFFQANPFAPYAGLVYGLVMGFAFLLVLQHRYQLIKERRLIEVNQALGIANAEKAKREEQRQFLSMLTHELKTPLSVLKMASNLDESSAKSKDYISNAINDMTDVINRCIMNDQLDDSRIKLNIELVDVGAMIWQLLEQHESAQRFDFQIEQDIELRTDAALFRIVVTNLISNAIKYGDDNQPIEVQLSEGIVKGRSGVLVSVRNQVGDAGLPDPDLVFQKYYRAPKAYDKTGSGLGLYLTKNIVEMLGGEISCVLTTQIVTFEMFFPHQDSHN
ncbi:MAG: 7TM-DISM domain-containing protein [Polynucleobacter sp.]